MRKDLIVLPDSRPEFRLFGAVEAYDANGSRVDLGSEKERCLIAALLLVKGRPIARDTLLEWLWDTEPASVENDLAALMVKLRKRLDSLGLRDALVNRDRQCRLDVPADWVDVHRFRALIGKAQHTTGEQAAEHLLVALELSEGDPLAGLLGGPRISASQNELAEERRAAELRYAKIELSRGHHEPLVPVLIGMTYRRPTDHEVAGLAMSALWLAGRQDDALSVFRRHSAHLVDQGLETPQSLLDLQTHILRNEQKPRATNENTAADTPGQSADPDPAVSKPQPHGNPGQRVINKISAPVTGENIVFGIQNRTSG